MKNQRNVATPSIRIAPLAPMASEKEIVFVAAMVSLSVLGDMIEAFGFPRAQKVVVNGEARKFALFYGEEDRPAIVDCFLKAERSPAFIKRCDDKYNGGKPSAVKQWFGRVGNAFASGVSKIDATVPIN